MPYIKFVSFFTFIFSFFLMACTPPSEEQEDPETLASVQESSYGTLSSGEEIRLFTLTNSQGMEVGIITYGGIVTSIKVPDKAGNMGEVTLGFDDLKGYEGTHPFFGALIGRYGNRIAKGKFTLEKTTYSLALNNGPNSLHGGNKGFDKRVWEGDSFESEEGVGVKLSYTSEDGEEGYPGNLSVTVLYTLTPDNSLKIDYSASTDAPTVVNLTNHAYFNLKDAGASDILGHELQMHAESITPVDSTLIPTGEFMQVEGTAFDFRNSTPIGQRIDAEEEQIIFGKGYDHNYIFARSTEGLEKVITVYEPTSGRVMEVLTTQPGVQFYSGNFLDGTLTGRGGTIYQHRSGLCLETQHYPDSPNQPNFPSTRLDPGQSYQHSTVYRFSTR